MSNRDLDAGNIEAAQMPITVNDVVLTPKERKVRRTPWPTLDAARICFSLLIQAAPIFFWIAAACLHLSKPAFLIMINVGLGYCVAYLILRRLVAKLARASTFERQPVNWFIDGAGVRHMSSLFDYHIQPEGFLAFVEDKKRFLFFTSSQNCLVLPKRCLNPEQTGSLRGLIATWK